MESSFCLESLVWLSLLAATFWAIFNFDGLAVVRLLRISKAEWRLFARSFRMWFLSPSDTGIDLPKLLTLRRALFGD